MAENKDSTLQSLMKMFRVGLNKNQNADLSDRIRPLDTNLMPEKFDSRVSKLYKYFINNCRDSVEDYKSISLVWQDCDMLYYNAAIIKRAIDLVSDEVVQADLNFKCVQVEADNRIKDHIASRFDKWKLYNKVRPIAEDVTQYGNCGVILMPGEKGIEDIQLINIYDFKSVLQFTPFEVEQRMNKQDKFLMNYGSRERIEFLINSIRTKDNYSTYFKKYILGYQIGDYALPPWRFLHFKNNTSKSPFEPFGIPIFISSVAPYRQYDAGMTLLQAMRGASLPIDKYEINAPNIVDPVSKVNYVLDFIRQFQNSGFSDIRKEENGIGETIFTIKDLFEYSQITPNIDLGKIGDIDFLREDMVISTGVPRNLVDPSDSGFGDSGVSLIQKWKPFARMIYRIQSTLLEQFTQLCKIDMIESGDFALDEIKFLLTMPYPESQVNSELITNQKDLIELSNEILQTLSDKLMSGEPVPPELVQAVMHEILPYDRSRIDNWIDIINKSKKVNIPQNPEAAQSVFNDLNGDISESLKKYMKNSKQGKTKILEHTKQIIFETKMKKINEGIIADKHYFSSQNQSTVFKPEMLREFEAEKIGKLEETGKSEEINLTNNKVKLKEYRFNEEIKYED
jgi:hypothetical protein